MPLLQSGFVSVTELVSAMSDTFKLKPAEYGSGQHWTVTVMQDGDSQSGVYVQKFKVTQNTRFFRYDVQKIFNFPLLNWPLALLMDEKLHPPSIRICPVPVFHKESTLSLTLY